MKKEIKEKLNDLERIAGIKDSGVVFFIKVEPDEIGKTKSYCYSEDKEGNRTYHKNGLPLTEKQLQNIETNCKIIIDDII